MEKRSWYSERPRASPSHPLVGGNRASDVLKKKTQTPNQPQTPNPLVGWNGGNVVSWYWWKQKRTYDVGLILVKKTIEVAGSKTIEVVGSKTIEVVNVLKSSLSNLPDLQYWNAQNYFFCSGLLPAWYWGRWMNLLSRGVEGYFLGRSPRIRPSQAAKNRRALRAPFSRRASREHIVLCGQPNSRHPRTVRSTGLITATVQYNYYY